MISGPSSRILSTCRENWLRIRRFAKHTKKVLTAVDEATNEFDGSTVAKDKIARIIITLNDKLATLKSLDDSILAAVEEPNIVTEVEQSTQAFNAKLPKLYTKKFTGDPKEWQSFWDSLSSAVHTNKALKNVDKFNFPRSLLEGSA